MKIFIFLQIFFVLCLHEISNTGSPFLKAFQIWVKPVVAQNQWEVKTHGSANPQITELCFRKREIDKKEDFKQNKEASFMSICGIIGGNSPRYKYTRRIAGKAGLV